MAEKVSLTEVNLSSDLGDDYDDYKCSICINFLNQPILTRCGHQFCHPCIKSWLQKNETCPICKEKLSMDSDTLPNKYAERKMSQLRIKCPNAKEGCPYQMSVHELENHTVECIFSTTLKGEDGTFLCPCSRMGCEETFASKEQLEEHMENFIKDHFTLAMRKIAAFEIKKKATNLEKEKQLIVNNCNKLVPVLNEGIFLWVVPDINKKVEKKETFSTKFWSKIPDGYVFTVQLSFKNDIAKIAIFIDKDSYSRMLKWPCKIWACQVSLLRDLTNQTKDSLLTEVEECSIMMPVTESDYDGHKINVNSKNVIEVIISTSEIKHFAINNKLYIKINMIFD